MTSASRWLRDLGVLTVFLFLGASLLWTTSAEAGCRGSRCAGKDPNTEGCTGNRTLYAIGFLGATVQMRASSSCRAAWSRSVSNTHFNTAWAQVWAGTSKYYIDTNHMADGIRLGQVQRSSNQITSRVKWGRMVHLKWLRVCGNRIWSTAIPNWRDCQRLSSVVRNPTIAVPTMGEHSDSPGVGGDAASELQEGVEIRRRSGPAGAVAAPVAGAATPTGPAGTAPGGLTDPADDPGILIEPGPDGVSVILVQGTAATTVARLAVPGVSTRLWTGYGCTTGSGKFTAVVFAPVQIIAMPRSSRSA